MFGFSPPKEYLLKLDFHYNSPYCHIKTIAKDSVPTEDLLIAAYLMFLAKYFHICDDRQHSLVKEILIREINNKESSGYKLTEEIYTAIFQTLNIQEQKAANAILPFGIPPFTYSEDDCHEKALANYIFFIYKVNNKLASYFELSFGPDKILLPLTVGILNEYVINKLNDYNKTVLLKSIVLQLLLAYQSNDCRSLQVFMQLPRDILIQNNIVL